MIRPEVTSPVEQWPTSAMLSVYSKAIEEVFCTCHHSSKGVRGASAAKQELALAYIVSLIGAHLEK